MKKYFEIYKEIKERIISGEYRSGEKLTSKRVLADKLGVSVITTEKAYAMLVDEGYIAARERSGYFVCDLGAVGDRSGSVDMSGARRPEPLPEEIEESAGGFEYSVYFKTLRRVISEKGERLFARSPNKGCAVLRNAISEYLFRYRGMYAPPSRIVIGSGSEQLYESAVKMLGRDKVYGIEDPSYSQIEAVYSGMGVEIKKLPMTEEGIATEALAEETLDVLHVTPFHSYPSGVTATAKKRWEYLEWAKRKNGYIIEDDFDSEFFLPGQPIEALYAMDKNSRVIYINTFSKSLSPSMRMGYMILPEDLLSSYDAALGAYSCTVPVLDQYVLAQFISDGDFERHLNRCRRKGRSKNSFFSERK